MKVARGTLSKAKLGVYYVTLDKLKDCKQISSNPLYQHHPNAVLHACNLNLTTVHKPTIHSYKLIACCLRYQRCKHASGKLTIRHYTSSACGQKAR